MTTDTTYQTQVAGADGAGFIRNTLVANSLFSGLSGALFVLASTQVSAFLGVLSPAVITVAAILLIVFAADLLFLATRSRINPRFVGAVVGADVVWVVGSILLLVTDLLPFTSGGRWAIGIVAVIVAIFAELGYVGLKRMTTGQ